MSWRRLLAVFSLDLAQNARRALTWVWVLVMVFLAWTASMGAMKIRSGDSSVGGVKPHVTSEFGVAYQMGLLTILTSGFFVAVLGGMAVIEDEECQVDVLLHATPLRPGEYIWGKFFAVAATAAIVLAVYLAVMIASNHVLPESEARPFHGPFRLDHYLKPALLFSVPTIVFIAGVSFAIGVRTGRPALVFVLPVVVFLACVLFVWRWTPNWVDPRVDVALMLIDPAGFRWLNGTFLRIDRGVRFYNTSPVPLDWIIVTNRAAMLGLGLGAVALSHRSFAAACRDASRRGSKTRTVSGGGPPGAGERVPARPLAPLGMTSGTPGLFAGAWAVAGAEVADLRSSAWLYLFGPLLILGALIPNLAAAGPLGAPLLLTPGTFAMHAFLSLTVMLCLLLLFSTVESLWRERRSGSIIMAAPVSSASLLLGKALASGLLVLLVLVTELVAAVVLILRQGNVGFSLWPFVLVWGILLVPTLCAWTAFVMATFCITRDRYATYAVGLGALIVTGNRLSDGVLTWVDNWPLLSAVSWSDISVFEFDRAALVLNRVLVLGLTIPFAALAIRTYGRRAPDASALAQRLRPGSLCRELLRLLPYAAVSLVAAAILWAKIAAGFEGDEARRLEKDYWRKNAATYRDWPLPDLTAVELDVTLDPPRGGLRVAGTYELINNQAGPLRQVPLSVGPHWEDVRWTWEGNVIRPAARGRLHAITPPSPLAPGARARVGFAYHAQFPAGISRGGSNHWDEFILPSAVVLHSLGTSFAPELGFSPTADVDPESPENEEEKEYADDFYQGHTDSYLGSRSPYRTRIKVTGPADFRFNSVGTITRESVTDGVRTTVWESDQPVNLFNIIAGRWAVRRGNGTAVYYHPAHAYNVAEMVETLDASRKYYSAWFHPFPWRELKLSEFPAIASGAMGFPTNITFSERVGFLTRSDPRANLAFNVTAHEAAHQWWGNMVAPGKGPGGALLAEGGADFSTLLLFEQVKGLHARIAFARLGEDKYATTRQPDSERPLVKTDATRDGDKTVVYDKTCWVLWMLLNHMGRERMLQGIQAFFATYRDNPDHPVVADFLRVVRPFAADPAAFDAFTRQWFYDVVVPEYRLTDVTRTQEGSSWKVTARLNNAGTGVMPVEVAAVRGERFHADGMPDPAYRDARAAVMPKPGGAETFTIRCGFEPTQLVVDPDVKVLQRRRKDSGAKF